MNHNLWWQGSAWLVQDSSHWPAEMDIVSPKLDPEIKTSAVNVTIQTDTWLLQYSFYKKLIRTVAWITQFSKNSKTA